MKLQNLDEVRANDVRAVVWRPVAWAVMCVLGGAAQAQTSPANDAPAAAPDTAPAVLPQVVVSGTREARSVVELGTQTLTGDRLTERRGTTLGETVGSLPGVTSAGFGPNVGRPVVRGQDGDRAPLVSNGATALDASALSQDHAVPLDPLAVSRVELLRGPAALRYSGNGVGGVINAVDNRVPRAATPGLEGSVETRLGGAANERALSGVVDGGSESLAAHADAFVRDTDDLHTPRFTRPDGVVTSRVANSASHAEGGALGGSLLWDHGHLGAALDTYRSHYGTVAEEDVTIRMRRDTLRLDGEVRNPGAWASVVRTQVSSTDYEHREIEGGATGTVFKNRGVDGRIEMDHAAVDALGGMRGMWGAQLGNTRFAALGEEAFVPSTQSTQQAAFALENWRFESAVLNLGLRAEHARVRSAGDEAGTTPRFGAPDERSFNTGAVSLGTQIDVAAGWKLLADVSHTERAPTFYELYANGLHVATGAVEVGDANLQAERGVQMDVGAEYRSGAQRARLSVYDSEFGNYIVQSRSAADDATIDGVSYPGYRFTGVKARLTGFEASGSTPLDVVGQAMTLDARLDGVRATNRDTGEPLPRIAPLRLGLGLSTEWLAWTWRADLDVAAKQDRVSPDDTPTPSSTVLNLGASHRVKWGATDGLLFVKVNNVGNALAYNAVAFNTVRDLSPAAGRSLAAGLRLNF
jgi:iron complex outermembrane receptor protein